MEFDFQARENLTSVGKSMAASMRGLSAELKDVDRGLSDLAAHQRELDLQRRAGLHASALDHEAARRSRVRIAEQQLALTRQRDALRRTIAANREAREVQGGWGAQLAASLSPLRALTSGLDSLDQSLRRGAATGALFRAGLSGIRAGVNLAGQATLGLAGLAAAGGVSVLREAGRGQEMREGLTARFGAERGGVLLERLRDYAGHYGVDPNRAASQFSQLTTQGFSQVDAFRLMQLSGDVAARQGPQAAEGILTALSQIKSKGRLQAEELRGQLAEHGINVGSVQDELGRMLGIRGTQQQVRDQVERRMRGGQISGDMGVAAVAATVRRDYSGGGLFGSGMERHAQSFGGALERITANWTVLQQTLGDDAAFRPIAGWLNGIADALDRNTPAGREFRAAVGGAISELSTTLGTHRPADMVRDLGHALATTVKVARGLAEGLGLVASGYQRVWDVVTRGTTKVEGRTMAASARAVRAGAPTAAAEMGDVTRGQRALNYVGTVTGRRLLGDVAGLAHGAASVANPVYGLGRMLGGRLAEGVRHAVQVHGGINVHLHGVQPDDPHAHASAVAREVTRQITGAVSTQGSGH